MTVTTDGDPASEGVLDLAVVETDQERMPEEHAAVAAILRY